MDFAAAAAATLCNWLCARDGRTLTRYVSFGFHCKFLCPSF